MKNETIASEVNVYFDDILRNKDMIKEMLKTNIMVYEDKIKQNEEKSKTIKDEIYKLNTEFQLVENKLKLEYAKTHDEFQKHDINFKLLDKTHTHYKMLIREREDEIKKIEEQSIFAHQDYQNKKVKHDCLAVQIVEAEFQLSSLQKQVDAKLNKIKEDEEQDTFSKYDCSISNISQVDRCETKSASVDQMIKEKMAYESEYTKRNEKSFLYKSMTIDNDRLRGKQCIIF